MKKNNRIINWDNPDTKYSHPGKTLSTHISEVNELFKRFCYFYQISPVYEKIMKDVANYHDMGKLNPEWNLNKDRRPSHADVSLRYLHEKGYYEILKQRHGMTDFVLTLYFILKHHSSLSDSTGIDDYELKRLCEYTRMLVEKMQFDRKVNLVDAFGLFKISDCLSAADNVDFQPRSENISNDKIKEMISRKNGKKLDEVRWQDQLRIAQLPNISFLSAYTGWGKTDASLLFCSGASIKKVFYLFPTITAINKFYEKVTSSFPNAVEKYFYLYEYELANKSQQSDAEYIDSELGSLMASHFLYPIMITTVDQFLLTFLQIGKYYMKRCMYRQAGIILDEVHLLNQKMLFLTLKFLKDFEKIYGLRVLFMSATFSNALLSLMKQEIGGDGERVGIMDRSEGYRQLRRVKYSIDSQNLMELASEAIEKANQGKRVLIVANTVPVSIKVAQLLEQYTTKDNVLLLHGRFMYRDRIIKERLIGASRNRPRIVVATQVCEVSLDESFDFLFTEIAPLPSIIQRFGRVNRYGLRTDDPNVIVCKEDRMSNRYPYDDDELVKSRNILEEVGDLKNEYQLIEKFNEMESFDELQKKYEEAARDVDFDSSWFGNSQIGQGRTSYFFSYRLDEDQTRNKLFNLRDELTVNILPDPSCVEEPLKNELTEKLAKMKVENSRSAKSLLFKELRGYMVQVPIYWLKGISVNNNNGMMTTVHFTNKRYSSRYGFLESSEVGNVV
jgi:CRISPR-associated endonuclease/helicase Cas3